MSVKTQLIAAVLWWGVAGSACLPVVSKAIEGEESRLISCSYDEHQEAVEASEARSIFLQFDDRSVELFDIQFDKEKCAIANKRWEVNRLNAYCFLYCWLNDDQIILMIDPKRDVGSDSITVKDISFYLEYALDQKMRMIDIQASGDGTSKSNVSILSSEKGLDLFSLLNLPSASISHKENLIPDREISVYMVRGSSLSNGTGGEDDPIDPRRQWRWNSQEGHLPVGQREGAFLIHQNHHQSASSYIHTHTHTHNHSQIHIHTHIHNHYHFLPDAMDHLIQVCNTRNHSYSELSNGVLHFHHHLHFHYRVDTPDASNRGNAYHPGGYDMLQPTIMTLMQYNERDHFSPPLMIPEENIDESHGEGRDE